MRHMPDTNDVQRMIDRTLARIADGLQVEHDRILASIPNASNAMVVEAVSAGAGTLAVIIAALRKAA